MKFIFIILFMCPTFDIKIFLISFLLDIVAFLSHFKVDKFCNSYFMVNIISCLCFSKNEKQIQSLLWHTSYAYILKKKRIPKYAPPTVNKKNDQGILRDPSHPHHILSFPQITNTLNFVIIIVIYVLFVFTICCFIWKLLKFI